MTIPTHIIASAIAGKLSGDYVTAIIAGTFVDFDHLIAYFRHGELFNRRFFKRIFSNEEDPWNEQRGWFHNIYAFVIINSIAYIFFPSLFLPILLGYGSHIILDLIDRSEVYPFFPNKKIILRGWIKYGTVQELILFFILLATFLII